MSNPCSLLIETAKKGDISEDSTDNKVLLFSAVKMKFSWRPVNLRNDQVL